MGATEILERLGACGVHIRVDGDELVLRPASKIPSDLLAQVKEPELLILLTGPVATAYHRPWTSPRSRSKS